MQQRVQVPGTVSARARIRTPPLGPWPAGAVCPSTAISQGAGPAPSRDTHPCVRRCSPSHQMRPQATEPWSFPAAPVVGALWGKHGMALAGEKGRRQRGAEQEALAGECWAVSKASSLSSLRERETEWQRGPSVCSFGPLTDLGSSRGTAARGRVTLAESVPHSESHFLELL